MQVAKQKKNLSKHGKLFHTHTYETKKEELSNFGVWY